MCNEVGLCADGEVSTPLIIKVFMFICFPCPIFHLGNIIVGVTDVGEQAITSVIAGKILAVRGKEEKEGRELTRDGISKDQTGYGSANGPNTTVFV